jgi:uncharacterized surface protein with fasciclin (FAS1) repeats
MKKNEILTPLKYITMLAMALSLIFLTNCSDEDDVDTPADIVESEYENIMQTLADVGEYDTLIDLLEKYPIDANGTLLSSLFSADGTYTLFAPNNDAFLALYTTVGVSKASDVSPAIIVSLLTYHGAGTVVNEIVPGASIATVNGESIIVNLDNPDADGTEGSPENGTLLTGSNTQGIVVADEPIMASNGVIWNVGTVLIPPSTGGLLASILGTNAASVLISSTFSNMGAALLASDVFAAEAGVPSLSAYLANPDVMSTVFGVPNLVFDMTGISVTDFAPEEWYAILAHHIVGEAGALKATDDASKILDAAALTGGSFNDGLTVESMLNVSDDAEAIYASHYIKYDAALAGQFGGGTGVLIDSDFDEASSVSDTTTGFWNAEVLYPDAVVNGNGVIHVIVGLLSPTKPEAPENPIEGTWTLAPVAGALAVGPATDDLSWWSSDAAAVTARDCHFDDQYVFDAGTMSTNDAGEEIWSGEYTILTDGSTWIETWQGVDAEGCGDPVAPHDESNAPFTYVVNNDTETVTLYGIGAYFGLPKATNEGELSADAPPAVPSSITYNYVGGDDEPDHHATFQVVYPGGVWQFILANADFEGEDGNGGGEPNGPTDVTFHLDFNTYLADTSKTETAPFLNGTFNGWCGDCNPMTDEDGDGIYTITIPLDSGLYEWKFTAGGWNDQEMFDAGTAGTIGDEFVNRLLTVLPTMMEMNVGPYCWNTFEPCPPPSASVTFRLNFSTYLADTSKTETAPFLNGTFNGWCGDCNPMTESTVAGVYTITIPLPAGDHELKFTAGGWNDQEMFDAGTEGTVGTEFVNRTITIVETDIDTDVDYGVYCWNQFVDCE